MKRIIVGLTGMSGAGKSTVCRVFRDAGFDIVDCDQCAREVTKAGKPALSEIRKNLCAELVLPDGTLDRRKTAELIFHDAGKKASFNKIIYPYITYNIAEKLRQSGQYALLDAPTLFEAGLDFLCDEVVSVIADAEGCVRRITARDGISDELARARLLSQHDADFYRERSAYCIENNGTMDELFQKARNAAARLKGDI